MIGASRDLVARWLHARLVDARPTGLRRRGLMNLRALLVAMGDPSVQFRLAGMTLLIPLSHDLPLLRSKFPLYSDNLARLTRAVGAKYPDLAVVDIGANVGDSVALIRSAFPAPILCVEGDSRYLEFLRVNTAPLRHVSIAPVFVGAATGELAASIENARGTGHLKVLKGSSIEGPSVHTVTLDALIGQYPLAGRLKLLKSDTDGFEGRILLSALASLKEHRPVLFFEYDPDLLSANGVDGLELFQALSAVGYVGALLYDNLGDLMLSADLDDRRHLEEIDGYFSGRRSERYLDVAAFHAEDTDIFESFRKEEIISCRAVRSANGSSQVL